PGIDALEPIVVPAKHLLMRLMEGPLLHRRQRLQVEALDPLHLVEAVDGAVDGPAASPLHLEIGGDLHLVRIADSLAVLPEGAAEVVVADELALGAAGAAHVGNHMAVAAADHGADVAGFDPAIP